MSPSGAEDFTAQKKANFSSVSRGVDGFMTGSHFGDEFSPAVPLEVVFV